MTKLFIIQRFRDERTNGCFRDDEVHSCSFRFLNRYFAVISLSESYILSNVFCMVVDISSGYRMEIKANQDVSVVGITYDNEDVIHNLFGFVLFLVVERGDEVVNTRWDFSHTEVFICDSTFVGDDNEVFSY